MWAMTLLPWRPFTRWIRVYFTRVKGMNLQRQARELVCSVACLEWRKRGLWIEDLAAVGQLLLNFTHMKSTLQKRIKERHGTAEEIS